MWGLSGAAGSLGGTLFQLVTGQLVDRFSYSPVFIIVACMHLVSAAIVMVMIPRALNRSMKQSREVDMLET